MNCNDFKRNLYHFQADELPAAQRLEAERHVEACRDCAARLEFEDGMLRAIRGGLERVPAPPGLETRIRASLAGAQAPRRAAFGWLRTPRFAAAATALLLAVLISLPSIELPTARVQGSANAVEAQEVTVVDLQCDRAGRAHEVQRGCAARDHINVFKLPDGRYWHISQEQMRTRKLMFDAEMRGRRMLVDGTFYPAIQTIQLERAQILDPLSAALTLN